MKSVEIKDEIIEVRGVRLDITLPFFVGPIRAGILAGWYESDEAWSVEPMLAPGETVLEIGAGCGFLSCFIAKLNRNNLIHAVEADPRLIPIIYKHYEFNDVCAFVHHEVMGADDGISNFYIRDLFWSSSLSGKDDWREVISVPMTAFRRRLEEWRPTAIVIDIEGGELDLLLFGLPSFVNKIVLEIHPGVYGSTSVNQVMDLIANMGFVKCHERNTVLSFARNRA
jgi:FkbM family methyltransferase